MILKGSRVCVERRKAKTSCLRMRPSSFVRARFRSIAAIAAEFSSTNNAEAAPRLSASIPNAPVPAKRSRTRAPIISSPRLEKIAALTRSIVGRTSVLGTSSRMPPAAPAITLMAMRLAVAKRRQSRLPQARSLPRVRAPRLAPRLAQMRRLSFSFSPCQIFRRL